MIITLLTTYTVYFALINTSKADTNTDCSQKQQTQTAESIHSKIKT